MADNLELNNIGLIKDAANEIKDYNTINGYYDLAYDTYLLVEDLIEEADTLPKVELGSRLAIISNNLEILSGDGILDMESFNTVDLEGIKETLGNIGKSLKDFFTSTSYKLAQLSKNTIIWTDNNTKLISEYTKLIPTKSDDIKSPITDELGDKLATVNIINASLSDVLTFTNEITSIGDNKSSMNAIDKLVLAMLPNNGGLTNTRDFIKVTRIDGNKVSYIVIADTDTMVGFRSYIDTSIPKNILKKYYNTKIPEDKTSLSYAKKLLDTAKKINSNISTSLNTFIAENKAIEPSLKADIEDARYKSGPILRNTNKEFLFYALGAIGIISGGGLIVSAIPKGIVKLVSLAGRIFVSTATTTAKVAKPILNNKVAGGLALASGSTAIIANKDNIVEAKDVVFEKLSQRDKQIILNNRIKLNGKLTLDAIYGLNSLVTDLIYTARIIIDSHTDK